MKVQFNNDLEALYGIDYCINRRQNIIKQPEIPEEKHFFDELVRIYLEKVPETTREDVAAVGDYHRKAEYVLNPQNALPDLSAFNDFFSSVQDLQERIILDVSRSPELKQLQLDELRDYLGIDNSADINLILSMFVSGGFGVFNGSSNLILGVRYDEGEQRYRLADRLANPVNPELAYPYVHMKLYEDGIHANDRPSASLDQYTEELITRVLEIYFTSRLYGNDFIERALTSQNANLAQTRIFLSVYLENQNNIKKLDDYINLLLGDGLLVRDAQ
jgi:hypothetical protein